MNEMLINCYTDIDTPSLRLMPYLQIDLLHSCSPTKYHTMSFNEITCLLFGLNTIDVKILSTSMKLRTIWLMISFFSQHNQQLDARAFSYSHVIL